MGVFTLTKQNSSRLKLKFTNPLKASLSIHKFQEKRLPKKISMIKVNNISINDLQFTSHLDFPIDSRILLFFRLQLFGQTHHLYGVIVSKEKKESNKFDYCVELKQTQLGYIKSVLQLSGELNQQLSIGIS